MGGDTQTLSPDTGSETAQDTAPPEPEVKTYAVKYDGTDRTSQPATGGPTPKAETPEAVAKTGQHPAEVNRAQNIRRRQAEDRLKQIKRGLLRVDELLAVIEMAHAAEDWKPLGLPNWKSYVAKNLATELAKVRDRKYVHLVVGMLRDEGYSSRKLAEMLHVSQSTASRAIREVSHFDSPEAARAAKVKGKDGKQHPAAKTGSAPRSSSKKTEKVGYRVPLTDADVDQLAGVVAPSGLGKHLREQLETLLPGTTVRVGTAEVHRELEGAQALHVVRDKGTAPAEPLPEVSTEPTIETPAEAEPDDGRPWREGDKIDSHPRVKLMRRARRLTDLRATRLVTELLEAGSPFDVPHPRMSAARTSG